MPVIIAKKASGMAATFTIIARIGNEPKWAAINGAVAVNASVETIKVDSIYLNKEFK